jgi:hypothetical protein
MTPWASMTWIFLLLADSGLSGNSTCAAQTSRPAFATSLAYNEAAEVTHGLAAK